MRKKILDICFIASFIVSPPVFIGYLIVNLFRNPSFNFFGFGLIISDLNQMVKINLIIKPEFLITFLFVFLFSASVSAAIILIKDRKKVSTL